jgi:predicted nucleotidyltransferase
MLSGMSLAADPVLTLPERKRREAERRTRAAAAICDALADFGRREGGRFLVFGSAAAGTLHARSDLDVIVDVPREGESRAQAFVEDLAQVHGMPLDLHVLGSLTAGFLEIVGPGMRVLP